MSFLSNNLDREGKPYTAEEEEQLHHMVGMYSFITIGKRLGRSPEAIESKLTRMGLVGTKLGAGYISAHELCQAIGETHQTLLKWREEYNLPLKKKNLRYNANKNLSWHIFPDEFWEWADKNRKLVNWKRYKLGSLLPEPSWVYDAIRESSKPKNNKRPWTSEEDNELWYLYYTKGEKQKDIAKKMERSLNGIERRLKRLRDAKLGKGVKS